MGQFFGFSPTRYSVQMENNRFIKRREKAQQRRRQGVYNMFANGHTMMEIRMVCEELYNA